jgi:hypothetical protein
MPNAATDLELRDLLLNPFIYPKTHHRRTLNPHTVASYKAILRAEFGFQCVYCRLPDGVKGQDSFGVDHYRPRSLFPELRTTYSNLFYACNACNRRKGDYWPSSDELRARRFIPNPCDHIMFEHLRYRGARVEPHSPAGEHSEKRLMLNDDESVQYREFVFGLIAMSEEKKRSVSETISRIERKLSNAPEQEEVLQRERQSCVAQLDEIDSFLARLTDGGT